MADVEQALADCVGAVYEAAAGGDGWFDVGERMRQLFDAVDVGGGVESAAACQGDVSRNSRDARSGRGVRKSSMRSAEA